MYKMLDKYCEVEEKMKTYTSDKMIFLAAMTMARTCKVLDILSEYEYLKNIPEWKNAMSAVIKRERVEEKYLEIYEDMFRETGDDSYDEDEPIGTAFDWDTVPDELVDIMSIHGDLTGMWCDFMTLNKIVANRMASMVTMGLKIIDSYLASKYYDLHLVYEKLTMKIESHHLFLDEMQRIDEDIRFLDSDADNESIINRIEDYKNTLII